MSEDLAELNFHEVQPATRFIEESLPTFRPRAIRREPTAVQQVLMEHQSVTGVIDFTLGKVDGQWEHLLNRLAALANRIKGASVSPVWLTGLKE